MPATIKRGRKKGGHNRGYYYHKTKGAWCESATQNLLRDASGDKITDHATGHKILIEALSRHLATQEQAGRKAAADAASGAGVSVQEICSAYLLHCKANNQPQTFRSRQDALFDFCLGLPAGLREKFVKGKLSESEIAAARIHHGFGALTIGQCIFNHLTQWLAAHPAWKGGKRFKIQAVKRAMNWAVEEQLISRNPFAGYKSPKSGERLTYITPEQEQAIYAIAKPALADAIQILIRTGCRPSEFCNLTAQHVSFDDAGRMTWTYTPAESKTKVIRKIRISDAEIIRLTVVAMKQYPKGKIWHGVPKNGRRRGWTVKGLSQQFCRTKKILATLGTPLDAEACVYSTRHTYARRILLGYWTGKPTNTHVLSALMGNSPAVAAKYAKWCDSYTEPLGDCVADGTTAKAKG